MAYKLIAIDIDDTLLGSDLQIPAKVKLAIEKAVSKGAYVVLCTGRTKKGAVRYYEELGLDTLFIVSGGAQVFDVSGKLLYSRILEPSVTRQLLQYAHDNNIHAQVYIDDELCYKESNRYSDAYERPYGHKGIEISDILERKDIVTPKVLYIIDEDRMEQIQNDTEKLFPMLTIMRSKPVYLEFTYPGVSKGDALQFTANHYHVDQSETIALGDSQIDIPMLKYAGLGVAVANAAPEVRKAADLVCASNDDGGVADVIKQYILET